MATPNKSNNWLLVKFRSWHGWGGAILSLFIIVVALTGIYLNHKNVFGFETHDHVESGLLRTDTALAAIPVSFDQAQKTVRAEWGETAIEKIELKDENGILVYKIKQYEDGPELMIDANTGATLSKYNRPAKAGLGGIHWNRFLKDLHTGKLGGMTGKLLVDFTSIVIIVLTLSGIYLWMVPILRKRRTARETARKQAERATLAPEGVAIG